MYKSCAPINTTFTCTKSLYYWKMIRKSGFTNEVANGIFNTPVACKINGNNQKNVEDIKNNKKLRKKPHFNHNIGDVNITASPENIHLGTLITVNGPVSFEGMSRNVLLNIKADCKCENSRKELRLNLRSKNKKPSKTTQTFLHRWSFKKCLLLGIAVTTLEVLVLFSHYVFFYKTSSINFSRNDALRINELNINLKRFVHRPNSDLNEHECTHQCYTPAKSKIKFIIPFSSWFKCLYTEKYCKEFISNKFRNQRFQSPISHDDIYYNYLVSMRGTIYEAHPLNCPFDDEYLANNDHSSVITIGIAYCFPGNAENNRHYSLNVYNAVEELLRKLQEAEFLNKQYILEFPGFCKNTFLSNFTAQMQTVSFYEVKNDIEHSFWNPKTIRNLLFSSVGRNMSDIPSVIPSHSLLQRTSQCSRNNTPKSYFTKHTKYFGLLTIKYTHWIDKTLPNYCKDESDCYKKIIGYISAEDALQLCSFNYFISLKENFVFEGDPLNCSVFKNQWNKEISIFIRNNHDGEDEDAQVNRFSKLLPKIIKDIKKYINYSDVSFKFTCESKQTPIMTVYEILTDDVSYVSRKGFFVPAYSACND